MLRRSRKKGNSTVWRIHCEIRYQDKSLAEAYEFLGQVVVEGARILINGMHIICFIPS